MSRVIIHVLDDIPFPPVFIIGTYSDIIFNSLAYITVSSTIGKCLTIGTSLKRYSEECIFSHHVLSNIRVSLAYVTTAAAITFTTSFVFQAVENKDTNA